MNNLMATPDALTAKINSIAEKFAKTIRHADVISHDPEGQRIKGLIIGACWEAYELGVVQDTGITTTVTRPSDVAFVVGGMQMETTRPAQISRPAEIMYAGLCAVCEKVHDPRLSYDHAPEPVKQKKPRRVSKRK
jgi:hypothetical protein